MKPISMTFFVIMMLVLCWTTASQALEPPTAEQIKQYKKDGTWEERKKAALAIGNHKMAPELVAKTNYKLSRLAYEAAGKSAEEINKILPTPPLAWQGMPTTGDVKIFVLLIEFSDYPHIEEDSQSAVHTKIFGPENTGSSNYPYESLNAYYNRSSYGLLNLSGGSTLGWYNAGSRSSVDESDDGREELIKTAINSFDAAGHDFSQYDNNGDGVIDYFGVIWTGQRGDWSSFWWGYQTSFLDDTYTVDGKQLGKYSWQWESRNYPSGAQDPLVLIHETGHALGLPDYYDYDDSVGPQGGIGGLDMMDHNLGDHNAFSKFVLDWLNPDVIAATGNYPGQILSSSASSADALLVMPNASGSPFEEFFMVQHRKREKNDTEIPTDGLLIWHVDARLNSGGTNYLYDNSYADHKLLRLMEADGLEEIEQNLSANEGDFYIAGNSFTSSSSPDSNAYGGLNTGVQVTNIAAAGNDVTFDAALLNVPSVSITSPAPLSAVSGSVSIAAEASGGSGGIAQVEFFVNNSSIGTDTTAPYSVIWDASAQASGKYHLKAVVKDGSGNENFAQESVYVATGSSKVLIIDLASANKSGEAIGEIAAQNNVIPVSAGRIPDNIDISLYPAVFVCLGYGATSHALTENESSILVAYLNNGGGLYLEGGETWAYDPDLPIHDYFGINGVYDGETSDLATVSGSGLAAGIRFASVGVNNWVDRLEAVNGGTVIWQNSTPVYIVGVSNQTATYRTIGCSFEFGNIPDANRRAVMARYLSFFGISIPPNTNFLPAVFQLLL